MRSDEHHLLLFHHTFVSEEEISFLRKLILSTESPDQFCQIHELVNRNRITSSQYKILRESRRMELRPFRFLINKN